MKNEKLRMETLRVSLFYVYYNNLMEKHHLKGSLSEGAVIEDD